MSKWQLLWAIAPYWKCFWLILLSIHLGFKASLLIVCGSCGRFFSVCLNEKQTCLILSNVVKERTQKSHTQCLEMQTATTLIIMIFHRPKQCHAISFERVIATIGESEHLLHWYDRVSLSSSVVGTFILYETICVVLALSSSPPVFRWRIVVWNLQHRGTHLPFILSFSFDFCLFRHWFAWTLVFAHATLLIDILHNFTVWCRAFATKKKSWYMLLV